MSEAVERLDVNALNLVLQDDLNQVILYAEKMGASDIIFKTGDPVWARIHGQWRIIYERKLSTSIVNSVTATITNSNDAVTQILSGQDLDLSYEIKVDRISRKRFRVNATATHGLLGETGIAITLRTIPEYPPKLDDLEIPEEMRKAFFPKYGLVLVTGPVGSGKSTLLFSVLREIAETQPSHIITYEAPVEFDITSLPNRKGPVEQTEVGRHLNDFKNAPRNSLRRAGDVVLFGESRDAETIRSMSIEAETGVAVYSTVHTNSVAETISRMIREFPMDERSGMMASLISATRLIVHQRLLRRPDGSGRIAVREWLVFDEEVVSELENLSVNDLIPVTRKIIERRGSSLRHDLQRKMEAGLIDEQDYHSFIRSLGIKEKQQ